MDKEWLIKCATAGEFLYGKFPVNILLAMFEKKAGCRTDSSELIAMMQKLEAEGSVLLTYKEGVLNPSLDEGPGYFIPKDVRGTNLEGVFRQADRDGNPYASMHFDMDEQENFLSETPTDVDFYIPTFNEIEELVEHGFIRSKSMVALEKEITSLHADPKFLESMWAQISTNKLDGQDAINEIISGIFKKDVDKDGKTIIRIKGKGGTDLDMINGLLRYVGDFINNINIRNRRGWTPSALFKKQYPKGYTEMPVIRPGSAAAYKALKSSEKEIMAMGARVDYGTIGNYATVGPHGERRVFKVGPNDLCPCGSGLKYKKCHGKNR